LVFGWQSFLVHMVIAFTAFFHALFEQAGVDSFYKDEQGVPLLKGGQPRLWEIRECIRQYWDSSSPARKNLELMVELRDMIEHRYAPAFDLTIAGECQALLLNYERLMVEEFSPYYSLGANISIPLQVSHTSAKGRVDALRELQKNDYKILKEYVDAYRSALGGDVYSSPEYTFRVFLVQVPANREKSSDMTMEFIRYDEISGEQIDAFERAMTLIKTRTIPVANHGVYKPGDVVKVIQEIEPRFRMHEHTMAWRFFNVRKSGKTPEGCNVEYCQFDEAHKDYVYKESWVQRLKEAVLNPKTYGAILNFQ